MESTERIEKVLSGINQISEKRIPFEDCFEELLHFLVASTGAACGGIYAEFENTNCIIIPCVNQDRCTYQTLLSDFFVDAINGGTAASTRKFLLFSDLESRYRENGAECHNNGVVFPLHKNRKFFGFIYLSGIDVGADSRKHLLNIKHTYISYITKVYSEKYSSLLNQYYSIETEVAKQTITSNSLDQVSRRITKYLNLMGVVFFTHDADLSCLDVISTTSSFPGEIKKVLAHLHLRYQSNTPVAKFLHMLKEPSTYSRNTLIGITKSSFNGGGAQKLTEFLSEIEFKEILFSPSQELIHGKRLIVAALKKNSRTFLTLQIELFRKLTELISLSFKKMIEEQIQVKNEDNADIVQEISRSITEDEDLNLVATTIRKAFKVHTCSILSFDRLEDVYSIEGFSSRAKRSETKELETAGVSLTSLRAAGYELSDLHKMKTTGIDEYISAIENQSPQAKKFLTALKHLQGFYVLQVPLFDSFRRLLGFFIVLKEPHQQITSAETELLRQFCAKIANAIEVRNSIYYDSLTGLPNQKKIRPLVVEKLISSIVFSLLICKIVNLKEIVISRGDEIVDRCIIRTAKRIKDFADSSTKGVLIGRNTSEASFVIVFPSISNSSLESFSDGLCECIGEPIEVDGSTIQLHSKIGICHSTDIWETEMLYNYSKLAIQEITEEKVDYRVFDSFRQQAYAEEKELEEDIQASLEKKNFIAHYQPKVASDGSIVGYEALVRWQRDHLLEYPDKFIDKVEKMGLIQPLFEIVLEKTCVDLKQGGIVPRVSINISPSQLANRSLPKRILSLVNHFEIDPKVITFEFIETAILNADYYETIKELKNLGFKLSLDDFGTGFARYKTLVDLFNQGLIHELKIDKTFVDEIHLIANQSFIRSIVFLAKEFDITIVVEGVETLDQMNQLRLIDPELLIQGWLVSKALPLNEVQRLDIDKIKRQILGE